MHPQGGCGFARHGSYERVDPPGTRIARWYCRVGHQTFSLTIIAHCCRRWSARWARRRRRRAMCPSWSASRHDRKSAGGTGTHREKRLPSSLRNGCSAQIRRAAAAQSRRVPPPVSETSVFSQSWDFQNQRSRSDYEQSHLLEFVIQCGIGLEHAPYCAYRQRVTAAGPPDGIRADAFFQFIFN